MTDYYTRINDGELRGPFPDRDSATNDLSRWMSIQARPSIFNGPRLQILLDVGTLTAASESDFRRLMQSDPNLYALYKLGFHHGLDKGLKHGKGDE